jgi:hypothetical protein
MVLVAASGNAGPKSLPLYPAANPNVIAVSATAVAVAEPQAFTRGGDLDPATSAMAAEKPAEK